MKKVILVIFALMVLIGFSEARSPQLEVEEQKGNVTDSYLVYVSSWGVANWNVYFSSKTNLQYMTSLTQMQFASTCPIVGVCNTPGITEIIDWNLMIPKEGSKVYIGSSTVITTTEAINQFSKGYIEPGSSLSPNGKVEQKYTGSMSNDLHGRIKAGTSGWTTGYVIFTGSLE